MARRKTESKRSVDVLKVFRERKTIEAAVARATRAASGSQTVKPRTSKTTAKAASQRPSGKKR